MLTSAESLGSKIIFNKFSNRKSLINHLFQNSTYLRIWNISRKHSYLVFLLTIFLWFSDSIGNSRNNLKLKFLRKQQVEQITGWVESSSLHHLTLSIKKIEFDEDFSKESVAMFQVIMTFLNKPLAKKLSFWCFFKFMSTSIVNSSQISNIYQDSPCHKVWSVLITQSQVIRASATFLVSIFIHSVCTFMLASSKIWGQQYRKNFEMKSYQSSLLNFMSSRHLQHMYQAFIYSFFLWFTPFLY